MPWLISQMMNVNGDYKFLDLMIKISDGPQIGRCWELAKVITVCLPGSGSCTLQPRIYDLPNCCDINKTLMS